MTSIMTTAVTVAILLSGGSASAEILAMMSYESKPAEDLKSLKLSGELERREGIAIIDVDPESPAFGKWLVDIPLDPSGVAHHIFYDRTMSKAYLRNKSPQRVIQELRELYRDYQVTLIRCQDTNFLTIDRKVLTQLAPRK